MVNFDMSIQCKFLLKKLFISVISVIGIRATRNYNQIEAFSMKIDFFKFRFYTQNLH